MDFYGDLDDLKALIAAQGYVGDWIEKGENSIQFQVSDQVVIKWRPLNDGSNGAKLSVQGPPKARLPVVRAIGAAKAKPARDGQPNGVAAQNYHYTAVEPDYVADHDSELIIGLVCSVGTNLKPVTDLLEERLKAYGYKYNPIRISEHIISVLAEVKEDNYYRRTDKLMTEGNNLREKTSDYGILAKAAAGKINSIRSSLGSEKSSQRPMRRRAFVISSLKHPDEVAALRKIYSGGFFLLGVHSLEERRKEYLVKKKEIEECEADLLINRDADEKDKFGQHTRDTYHLSDFFVDLGANSDKLEHDIERFLDLIFGSPFVTPTFDEYAMFMAFSASLRSADMSRQVGAVVARDCAIVATGANDVPKYGGGLYWPQYNEQGTKIEDVKNGRDYRRKGDTNVIEKKEIIDDVLRRVKPELRDEFKKALSESKLKDITEYGRIVHAEMDALLACARGSISTKDAHIFCTTFPCHNCAKHLIAAGIGRVVYVEPYPKSKALDFHVDSITLQHEKNKLSFEPFVGVGPRSFFNLFSVNLGAGYQIKRKNDDGTPVEWSAKTARLRMQMLPSSYIDREIASAAHVTKSLEKLK